LKKPLKLDRINRKILATVHVQANLNNTELADLVGLSPSACFQRMKSLKEAGYFVNFTSELDLDRICQHVLAYVEITLEDNGYQIRRKFESVIQDIPEFMDCLRLTGDVDYISFTCFPNVQELNRVCDELSSHTELHIKRIKIRIVLERSKWYLGYPISKLEWIE